MEEYKCICGKSFQSEKSLCAHKASCKMYYLQKYGNLDVYTDRIEKIRESAKTQNQEYNKRRKELIVNRKQDKLNRRVSEQHRCETCGKIMTEKFASGRFCCRSCANKRQHSEETKNKIQSALLKFSKPKKYCKKCGKQLQNKNKSGYCFQCRPKTQSEESIRKQSETMKKKGYPRWNVHRNKLSFAEEFFANVLKKNDIHYVHDYSVKNDKNYKYYLDFYIVRNNFNIDLEIDGKQHEIPERVEHDKRRDAFLTQQNYIVYRIKWNDLRSDKGKKMMEDKINKFFEFYNSL